MSDEREARLKTLQVVGSSVEKVGEALLGTRTLSVDIVGLSIRGPRTPEEDILVTIRGVDDAGGRVVAFFSGQYLAGIFVGIERQIANGTLSWKEDKYAK